MDYTGFDEQDIEIEKAVETMETMLCYFKECIAFEDNPIVLEWLSAECIKISHLIQWHDMECLCTSDEASAIITEEFLAAAVKARDDAKRQGWSTETAMSGRFIRQLENHLLDNPKSGWIPY